LAVHFYLYRVGRLKLSSSPFPLSITFIQLKDLEGDNVFHLVANDREKGLSMITVKGSVRSPRHSASTLSAAEQAVGTSRSFEVQNVQLSGREFPHPTAVSVDRMFESELRGVAAVSSVDGQIFGCDVMGLFTFDAASLTVYRLELSMLPRLPAESFDDSITSDGRRISSISLSSLHPSEILVNMMCVVKAADLSDDALATLDLGQLPEDTFITFSFDAKTHAVIVAAVSLQHHDSVEVGGDLDSPSQSQTGSDSASSLHATLLLPARVLLRVSYRVTGMAVDADHGLLYLSDADAGALHAVDLLWRDEHGRWQVART
jgi:hypothetical protein